MKALRSLRPSALVAFLVLAPSCSSTQSTPATQPEPQLDPGELCDPTNETSLVLTFDPPSVVVAPGQARPVRLIVEPDSCLPSTATFTVDNATVTPVPMAAQFDLRHATYDFVVTGTAAGKATLSAHMVRPVDNATADISLPVDVRDPTAPTCNVGGKVGTGPLDANDAAVAGTDPALTTSSVTIPATAFTRTDELAFQPFSASVACGGDLTQAVPQKPIALGPAVTFTASGAVSMSQSMRREVDFAIPINPATFPSASRMRHVMVLFSNPLRAKTPRAVAVASPRIATDANGNYVLKFSAPWWGTYQAAIMPEAGTVTRKRHLTHRAVIGFSMGAGGAASFGARHHDQFDAIAPLGGPSDWTWLLWFVENYALAGFCPVSNPTCQKYAPNLYPLQETYAHTEDWDHWWYQDGNGNGGHFPRSEYVQIFEDLALMQGDPASQSTDPTLPFFAAGPKRSDPWVSPGGTDCSVWVDPIDGDPNEPAQTALQTQCENTRCDPANTWKAPTGYYDDEYNPTGALPVISFCDGGQTGTSPYDNTWAPPPAQGAMPVSLVMAVDTNNNGVRDMGEPIIRSGHEPWDDSGTDGLLDAAEPGYDPVTNPDPNQDDYDYEINPTGTENDHRYEVGEPYRDYGLDGVPNSASLSVVGDYGENDGKYTMADGLVNFYNNDAHGIIAQTAANVPGGPMDDASFMNFDILADGGVRDIFNFGAVANHLMGAVWARTGANGLPLRSVAYYNGFDLLPGEVEGQPQNYVPANLRWADIADMPNIRYGTVDATADMIAQGDGQHVGTAAQLLYRLETSFYYVGHRWPDADRRLTEGTTTDNQASSTKNELGITCELQGKCETVFTGPVTGRTGPIDVTLPPGYASAANQDKTYPVVFVLHGYGQDPSDLEAVALITNNFMNSPSQSYYTRLAKFIVVYVDGRCRVGADGKPECIRGTFYLNSNRPDGPQMDSWFDEVVTYIDKNYRTMPPSDVDVTE